MALAQTLGDSPRLRNTSTLTVCRIMLVLTAYGPAGPFVGILLRAMYSVITLGIHVAGKIYSAIKSNWAVAVLRFKAT